MKSDPLKPRLDMIKKQADEIRAQLLSYASYARKLKLDYAKLVRSLANLLLTYTDLISKPSCRDLIEPDGKSIDEGVLRQFEREVKERIKPAVINRMQALSGMIGHKASLIGQVVNEAKKNFDNQLKIQKMKDTIVALNELLTKHKKKGAFSSMIAAKSTSKTLHCITMKLMEERSVHPEKYVDHGPTPPEFEDPNLYHYAIFSDNMVASSVVVNSAVKNAKGPSQHVFHVVTDKINLGAMQVMFKMKDYNGPHIEVRAVESYTFLNSSYVPVLKQLESAKSTEVLF